jgi:hypothetical protein
VSRDAANTADCVTGIIYIGRIPAHSQLFARTVRLIKDPGAQILARV